MRDYVILTDSSCDLPAKMADELEVTALPLVVTVDGKSYYNYLDEREVSFEKIYGMLRSKCSASTSAVNINSQMEFMEGFLAEGKDVLYLNFSSGLSSTYTAAVSAAIDLREKYPDRKIYTVDTLCASLGQGLLVYLTAMEKKNGGSIEEVHEFAEKTKYKICHWFTVDDLFFLKRGGRLSASTAVLGSMLNIKPVMHVNNDGKLINVDKVRGRKNSLKALLNKFLEDAVNPKSQKIFISHGDCIEDVNYLVSLFKEKGYTDITINYIGPVIGAHSGPGTVALFFVGEER
jgi:DegV family protein with EDD domain